MSTGTTDDEKAEQIAKPGDRSVSDARLDRLIDYIGTCRIIMGLTEWEIVLKVDRRPGSSDAIAEISVTHNRRFASFMASEIFFESAPKAQRHTVCHELCHLVTNDILITVFDSHLSNVLGAPAFNIFSELLQVQEEHAVDRFASIIEEQLPLPALDGDDDGYEAKVSTGEEGSDRVRSEEEPDDRTVRPGAADEGASVGADPETGGEADARAEDERPGTP